MSIITKTYYFGHDTKICDQDILIRVMGELHKTIINPLVSVNTKKEDYQLHEGIDHYTSEIKITYDSDDITVDDLSSAIRKSILDLLIIYYGRKL
jgi:hypothetical protein